MTTTATTPPFSHHHRRRHGSSAPLFLLLSAALLSSFSPAAAQPSANRDPYANNLRGGFNPAMAIIVVILISAFFFMAFFAIYLRRCGERADAASRPFRAPQGSRSRRSAGRGLDPAVIQTFPTLVYAEVKEHKIGKGALECAVCLSEFQDDETLRLLPKCDHVFHPDCIDAWLCSHTTCPVCRTNLAAAEGDAAPDAAAVDPTPDAAAVDQSADAVAAAAVGGVVSEECEREGADGDEVAADGRRDHVAIAIDEAVAEEPVQRMARNESKNRVRWWSRSMVRPVSFPRSYSMGHSMMAARRAEDGERYTLRLPEHIRRDVMAGKFQRSSSCLEGSARKGRRIGGEGSSRAAGGGSVGGRSFKLGRWEWTAKSDRWALFARTFSMKISPRGDDGAGDGSTTKDVEGGSAGAVTPSEGSVKGKKVFPA